MQEEFRKYSDTDYLVSNLGNVMNARSGELLSPFQSTTGYPVVAVYTAEGSKHRKVHQLVAETFLPKVAGKDIVNHKNGIKTDNRVDNLEWSDHSNNLQHAYDTGLRARGEDASYASLTEDNVVDIIDYLQANVKLGDIAREFGVTFGTIHAIAQNRTWKHVPRNGYVSPVTRAKVKLTPADIPEIRSLIANGESDTLIARLYGVNRGTIFSIRSGKTGLTINII